MPPLWPPPWPARSLAFRLGWRLTLVVLLAILIAAGGTEWRAVATVEEVDDAGLEAQARVVAAALPPLPDPATPLVLPDALTKSFRSSDGDTLFLVFDGERLAGSSDPLAAGKIAALIGRRTHAGFFRLPASSGQDHGMLGLLTPAGRWRVAVLQGREQTLVLLDSLIGNFLLTALWLFLPLGAALVMVGIITLRGGLRPLRQAAAAAAAITPGRAGAHLPTDVLPGEIVPLVDAVNDALARLQQALVVQHRFLAEAAHALRTPLAVLTARLDLLEGHPEVGGLRRDADRIARLVGQMLRMARLEGHTLDVSAPVSLHAVAVEAISALLPLGLQRQVAIVLEASAEHLPVRGNHAALVLAVGNLIDNALVQAPSGTAVTVAILPPATIAVSDRGPGVPATDRVRIFGRFERGATARYPGAGLGLAIVAEVAAAHGGCVRADAREGGGAAFVLDIGRDLDGTFAI